MNLPAIRRLCSILPALLSLPAAAKAEGEWNPDTTFPALPPEESIKTIEVPKGYHLECIASEPMVEEPSMIAFDGNGSLYVCETSSSQGMAAEGLG